MTAETKKARAEALLRLAETNDGRLLLAELQADFDASMRLLLNVDSDKLPAQQGVCRAYDSIFNKFVNARKELEGQKGNTHGAS